MIGIYAEFGKGCPRFGSTSNPSIDLARLIYLFGVVILVW